MQQHDDIGKVPRFLDMLDDAPITLPPADAFTVVCCSSWRDAAIGYRQAFCQGCNCLLGVSPRSWQFHIQNCLWRPLVCVRCLAEFRAEFRERWAEQIERVRENAPKRRSRRVN